MRRGFTLLEIIVVIIIIGVLATLGFVQYSAVIEKARGAEAKSTIGVMRTQLAALSLEKLGTDTVTKEDLGVGSGIPGTCQPTNYFSYGVTSCTVASCTITATRCKSGGKTPNATIDGTISLEYTSTGTDTWHTTGGY